MTYNYTQTHYDNKQSIINDKQDAVPFKPHNFRNTITITNNFKPVIVLSKIAYDKMYHFIDLCTDEIGWLGSVERNKNIFFVEDVFLFEQEVNSATTEIKPEGLAKFGNEILEMDNGTELWNKIRLWGHSHVNMDTSPSGQDDNQMQLFNDNDCDWFIRLIGNKKGKLSFTLYLFKENIVVEDISWMLYEEIDNTLRNNIKDSIVEKVKKKTYVCNTTYSNTTYNNNTLFDSNRITNVLDDDDTILTNMIDSITDSMKVLKELNKNGNKL